ncbi:hypothetical protein ACU686_06035 [Yinghuangia aomiensis]
MHERTRSIRSRPRRTGVAAGAALALSAAGLAAVLAPAANAAAPVTLTTHCVLPAGLGEGEGPQDVTVELTPAVVAPGGSVHAKITLGPGSTANATGAAQAPTTPSIDLVMRGGATGTVTVTGPEVPLRLRPRRGADDPALRGRLHGPGGGERPHRVHRRPAGHVRADGHRPAADRLRGRRGRRPDGGRGHRGRQRPADPDTHTDPVDTGHADVTGQADGTVHVDAADHSRPAERPRGLGHGGPDRLGTGDRHGHPARRRHDIGPGNPGGPAAHRPPRRPHRRPRHPRRHPRHPRKPPRRGRHRTRPQAVQLPPTLAMAQNGGAIDFGTVALNGQAQTVNGTLNQVTVTDGRGTNLGWSLTGTMSDLLSANGTDKIPAGNIGWTPLCAAREGSLSQVANGPAGPLGAVPTTLCSQAASEQTTGGVFTADAGMTLTTRSSPPRAVTAERSRLTLI